jgi:aminopeptidase YwaD
LHHVKILSTQYPDRFTGEPQEYEAANYIKKQFESYGFTTRILQVPVMGWEVTREPTLKVLRPEKRIIECAPFIFSGSSPPGGLKGELKYVGKTTILGSSDYEKFGIADQETHQWQGFIVGSCKGPACAQPGPPAGYDFTQNGPHYTWPCCIIGKSDLARIQHWMEKKDKIEVAYSIETRFKPDAKSYIVEANMDSSSSSKKRLIIGGHHDCMGAKGFPAALNSPGAMDNASGVAVVLELARSFKQQSCQKALTFCTFGGEERNFIMSSEYVGVMNERGKLSQLDCCLNVDGAAKGETLRLMSSSESDPVFPKIDLQSMATNVLDELELSSTYPLKRITPPLPRSDEWPFFKAGIPVFRAAWTQDYGDTYHRQGDTVEFCDDDEKFVAVYQIYYHMIQRLLRLN